MLLFETPDGEFAYLFYKENEKIVADQYHNHGQGIWRRSQLTCADWKTVKTFMFDSDIILIDETGE